MELIIIHVGRELILKGFTVTGNNANHTHTAAATTL